MKAVTQTFAFSATAPKQTPYDLAEKLCKMVDDYSKLILRCIPPNFKFKVNGTSSLRGMDIPKAMEIIFDHKDVGRSRSHLILTSVLQFQLDNPRRSGVVFRFPSKDTEINKMISDFRALGEEIVALQIPDHIKAFSYNDDSDSDSDSDPYGSIDEDDYF